jgi:hypothetical protein
VAARLRAAPRDDVRAVLAVFADGPEELLAARERLAERRTEPGGRGPVQAVALLAERQEEPIAVGLDARRVDGSVVGRVGATASATAGGFLDQPPRGGLPYPPGSSERRTTYTGAEPVRT